MSESNAATEDGKVEGDDQTGKYLTFLLDKESYGLSIRHVTEIIGLQAITAVPDVPEYIKGIINLRGKVIPIMDVRVRFGMDDRDYDARTCIIVINVSASTVGLIVDTVSEVMDIDDKQIDPPPTVGSAATQGFMQGVGKLEQEVKLLLDADKLLFSGKSDEHQQEAAA